MNTVRPFRVAILGGGSFGTALANIVAANGHDASLWLRDEQRARNAQSSRENSDYLPGYRLHDNLNISSDLNGCVREAEIIVIAVPSHSVREVARMVAPALAPAVMVISATKGIESPSFTLMSQVLDQELSPVRVGVLSGPNFAKEIIQNQYTGSVVASTDAQILELVPRIFSSRTFRVYTNRDPYGVELAGALKNIYAMVTGMANALGCGHNTQAMLLTRSLAEMGRFASKLGADPLTFLGLAGVGDLFLTCSSDLSRNYRVGYALGSGKPLAQALAEVGQVAEGVNTLKIVKQKADELAVYMPLVSALHAILFEQCDIAMAVQQLMTGQMASDVEFTQTFS